MRPIPSITVFFPQDKQKGGGGDLAGAQSVKLYLRACIVYLKSRFTETDSEQFLLDLNYDLCLVINFWLSKGVGGEVKEG